MKRDRETEKSSKKDHFLCVSPHKSAQKCITFSISLEPSIHCLLLSFPYILSFRSLQKPSLSSKWTWYGFVISWRCGALVKRRRCFLPNPKSEFYLKVRSTEPSNLSWSFQRRLRHFGSSRCQRHTRLNLPCLHIVPRTLRLEILSSEPIRKSGFTGRALESGESSIHA